MIRNLLLCLLLLGGLLWNAPFAHAQYEVKDSFYFMKDDNEFSDEEKDEEAQYVYQLCEGNIFQKTILQGKTAS